MKRLALFVAAIGLLAALPAAASEHGVFVMLPAQLHWASSKDLPPGVKVAVIEGDPNKAGWFTLRISAPPGALSPMHYHSNAEYVTVLSGTMKIGTGKVASAAEITLPAGSYVEIPAGAHHYVKMVTDVIAQVSGMGPMTQTNVKQ